MGIELPKVYEPQEAEGRIKQRKKEAKAHARNKKMCKKK